MTVTIGITGPIGCGKSTIVRWLGDLGAVTVDADAVARAVVEPGQPALGQVLREFGDAVRAAEGTLDRAALARIVFADPAALRRLEAIVHPAVRPRIEAAIAAAKAAAAPAVVVEAIKLVEGGLAALCDEVWLVTCGPSTQRARLVGRGTAPDDAAARLAAQGDVTARLSAAASRVIDVSGDEATTREHVTQLYRDVVAGRDTGAGAAGRPGR